MADLTPTEISEAFRLVRVHSQPVVHALIGNLEELVLIERQDRQIRAGLADVNAILDELGEPPTCLEEVERAGINLAVPGSYGWPSNPDLARDIARGK